MVLTIKDIARQAGVSVRTVSRVLNNSTSVSEATRAKILAVMDRFRYKPNYFARGLRKKASNFIGFAIPNTTNPSFTEFVRGSTEVLDKYGNHVIMCSSDDDEKKEDRLIRDFKAMWIAGMVLIPSRTENRDLSIFESIRWPTVLVDREIHGLDMDLVVIDNVAGAQKAVDYLVESGHRRIAILAGVAAISNCVDRHKGWEAAMRKNGLYDNELVFWDDSSVSLEAGHRMMSKALEQLSRIDAVFACSDIVAIGAMQAIEEKGLRIPEDISLIGFDDISVSEFLKPPLTTVHNPMYEMGKKAAAVLMDKIEHKSDNHQKYVIDCTLKLRSSVKVSH